MDGKLSGKVIVVAGAGGIGSGLVKRYAQDGARVVVGDIDLQAAQAAAKDARQHGGVALGVALDGSDEASVGTVIDHAISEFGGLDGFHANFAAFRDEDAALDIVDLPLGVFDEIMRINMRGFVVCTRLAIPPMKRRGGGSILYTSSAASFVAQPMRAGYAMSKVAVHALMRHVAMRFGPDGIRANALTPGVVTHDKFEEVVPKEFADAMRAATPRRRLGQPRDVAAMSSFLMSDDADFISGQLISVDGGRTMRQ